MKTLLQINTNVGWNATGRIAETIGRYAIDGGWRSYIAYGRDMNGTSISASELIKIGSRFDIASHGLRTRIFDTHGLGSTKATRNLINKIDAIAPDVVQLHNIHGYYLNYVELFNYLARADVPVVWTMHDCWPFTGHCAYHTLANCNRWKDGCHSCPLKTEYPESMMFDRSERNYNLKKETFTTLPNLHIVTVSNWLHDTVRESFLGKFPIYTIHNSVDIPRLKSVTRQKNLVLAVASNWEPRKGLSYILKLRELLPERIRIRVIGLSKSQLAALPYGIEGCLRINDRETLRKEFASASVFINPSMADTLAIVNLESLAVGTPVVAFDSGGMRESLSDETGIMVQQGNVAAMAGAINFILTKPDRFQPHSCRERIREHFSHNYIMKLYLDLYESLLPGIPESLSQLQRAQSVR